ncbi:nucleoid-associated protein [Stenotrophomonas acidaminiphila]|uniref:nucleoid-associated protein n=1 Tax=Stenotrophomonas TaxID=40323 RepID=UPI001375FE55|nr:nucleoid-associated protein [Stenotrophomonas acidaminiphila]NCT88550.1 nucleoid-associated protein [Stenotrophomonas acidaminiphila]
MPPKESHLSSAELDTLRLTRVIFHVWNPIQDPVLTLLDVEVPVGSGTYGPFFEDRLRAASRGTQFVFAGEHRPTYELCRNLTQRQEDFVQVSKELAAAFSSHHRGRQMAAGVIIVALASVTTSAGVLPLVFILKLDHRPVLTYRLTQSVGDVSAQIQHVLDALVEDKAAVQRSALVDVSDHFAWDVLAAERNEGAAPELRNFFRAFLSVEPREDASVLTRRAISTVTHWAKSLTENDMPEGEGWGRYKERAVQYMLDHANFDTDEFVSTVVRDSDESRRERVKNALREQLREKGVEGQEFPTRAQSVAVAERRTKIVTDVGVQIIFEGDRETHRVEVLDDPEHGPGAKKIVIRARRLTESGA